MGTYFVDEAAFEIESGAFVDRTVHVLQAPEDAAHDVGVLVSRSPIPAGWSLDRAVARQLEHEARAFRAHKRLASRALQVDGAPAFEVTSEWRGEAAMIYQRQVYVGLPGTLFLLTAQGPLRERGQVDAHFERALDTIRFRERG